MVKGTTARDIMKWAVLVKLRIGSLWSFPICKRDTPTSMANDDAPWDSSPMGLRNRNRNKECVSEHKNHLPMVKDTHFTELCTPWQQDFSTRWFNVSQGLSGWWSDPSPGQTSSQNVVDPIINPLLGMVCWSCHIAYKNGWCLYKQRCPLSKQQHIL